MQRQLNHQIFNMAKFIFFRWIRSCIHLANRIRVILEERKCYRSACVYFSWGRLIYVYSSFLSKSVRYTYSCLPDLFCVYRLHHWKYECCKKQYRLAEERSPYKTAFLCEFVHFYSVYPRLFIN